MSKVAVSPKFLHRISKWVMGYRASWKDLSWLQRIYAIGLIFIVGSILPLAVDKASLIGGGLVMAATVLLASGLAYECYAWLKPRTDNRFLTLLLSAPTAVGLVFASAFAGDSIHAATGEDPSVFGHANTLIALLMVLPLAAFAIVLLSTPAMLMVAVRTMYLVSKTRQRSQEQHIWLGVARVLAILLSGTAAHHLVQPRSWLDPRFPDLAAWSASAMDMYPDPSCSTNPSDRIARLNDDLIVVSRETAGNYVFYRANCPLVAEGTIGE